MVEVEEEEVEEEVQERREGRGERGGGMRTGDHEEWRDRRDAMHRVTKLVKERDDVIVCQERRFLRRRFLSRQWRKIR